MNPGIMTLGCDNISVTLRFHFECPSNLVFLAVEMHCIN